MTNNVKANILTSLKFPNGEAKLKEIYLPSVKLYFKQMTHSYKNSEF